MKLEKDRCSIHLENHLDKKTIKIRLKGFVDEDSMDQLVNEMKGITDSYRNGQHLILADMRGLKTMKKEVQQLFYQAIAYDRAHGAYKCAHLSDSAIQSLQLKKLAREISPDDSTTVNVVSVEEAEKVLSEYRTEILQN